MTLVNTDVTASMGSSGTSLTENAQNATSKTASLAIKTAALNAVQASSWNTIDNLASSHSTTAKFPNTFSQTTLWCLETNTDAQSARLATTGHMTLGNVRVVTIWRIVLSAQAMTLAHGVRITLLLMDQSVMILFLTARF